MPNNLGRTNEENRLSLVKGSEMLDALRFIKPCIVYAFGVKENTV